MSDTNSNREVANVQPTSQALASFVQDGKKGEWFSFDPRTREGGELLIKATLLEQKPMLEMTGETIAVSNFYANDVESVKDDGSVEEFTRIVIFDDKGNAFSCGSAGVRKSLAVMLSVRGNMPWNPPVRCKIKLRSLEKGKQFMTLEPEIDSLYPTAPVRVQQKSK